MAGPEIEQFKREMLSRGASQQEAENISDAELLREVMNTVGKDGRLGADIRCVVSVSMLTEGWDTNTVTHILGVRAFGTQLLCEQVVGRALRRQSYELNDEAMFDVEYADILGIPFDFTAKPVVAPPKPPKKATRVHAVKAREALTIAFPRVTGYRKELADEHIRAEFTADSRLLLTPELVGPCRVLLEGIVGEGVEIGPDILQDMRQGFQRPRRPREAHRVLPAQPALVEPHDPGRQPAGDGEPGRARGDARQGAVHLFRPALRHQIQLQLAGVDVKPANVGYRQAIRDQS
jgi:type III restriction enzyme